MHGLAVFVRFIHQSAFATSGCGMVASREPLFMIGWIQTEGGVFRGTE